MPLLHHIPKARRGELNIALGFSLADTPVFQFLHDVLALQTNRDDKGRYHWKGLLSCVDAPLLAGLTGPDGRSLLPALRRYRIQLCHGLRFIEPFADVLKTEGDYVNAGEAIATVASDTRLRLVADLPEKYAALRNSISGANFRLHYGDATLNLSGSEGRPVSVGRSVSAGSAYIPVTFEFSNRSALTPGSYVEVWLLTEERDGVVSVPETALTEEQGEHFVYVQLDEECYRKVPVTVGGRNGIAVEILSGLKGGEKVVVKGAYQVRLSSASVIPGHTHNH